VSEARRQHFNAAYVQGQMPRDTGISPPERRAAREGPESQPLGQALDLNCGTGINNLSLARHGWQVTGVDVVDQAITTAKEKAARESSIRWLS
jgi:2-polyprenyl-3-methyl-5-hydroxy-6-metoxy-1,4-benzoquinol methylase